MNRSALRAGAFQNNLQGTPETNRVGKENAFLDIDIGAFGKESPRLSTGRAQPDGVRVPRQLRSDPWVQMKANRKAGDWLTGTVSRRQELIVPFELKARLPERQAPAMNEAKTLAIAIMANPHAE